jgi:hypothetical protein
MEIVIWNERHFYSKAANYLELAVFSYVHDVSMFFVTTKTQPLLWSLLKLKGVNLLIGAQ